MGGCSQSALCLSFPVCERGLLWRSLWKSRRWEELSVGTIRAPCFCPGVAGLSPAQGGALSPVPAWGFTVNMKHPAESTGRTYSELPADLVPGVLGDALGTWAHLLHVSAPLGKTQEASHPAQPITLPRAALQ